MCELESFSLSMKEVKHALNGVYASYKHCRHIKVVMYRM